MCRIQALQRCSTNYNPAGWKTVANTSSSASCLPGSVRLGEDRRIERGAHGCQRGVGLRTQRPGVCVVNLAVDLFTSPCSMASVPARFCLPYADSLYRRQIAAAHKCPSSVTRPHQSPSKLRFRADGAAERAVLRRQIVRAIHQQIQRARVEMLCLVSTDRPHSSTCMCIHRRSGLGRSTGWS